MPIIRQVFGGSTRNRGVRGTRQRCRRLVVEPLESRQLLSISLPTIADVTLAAGTAIYVPLNGTDPGQTIGYAVTASDYSKLSPAIMPQSNKSLQFNVDINGVSRALGFQLFDNLAPITAAHIEALVQSGFYDGLSIYRNGKDAAGNPFVIQGGNHPPSGTIKPDQPSIAEEFNPDLRFTSAGLLAMARATAPGTTAAEFFITEAPARFLDFNYTIFGVQTYGTGAISTIAAMPNQSPAQDPLGLGYLVTPLTITSASIFTDTQNGVLELRAPAGVTGTVTVTVTASDGTNAPVLQSFTVTIQADSASNPANPFVSVTPAAPTSVTFLPPTGTSSQATQLNNSDSGHALQFLVSGVTSGNVVQLLADGRVIGQATAAGTSVAVTTDGAARLADGPHHFTAVQIAMDRTVSVVESGNLTPLSKTANVPSLGSPAVQVTVDTAAPQFTSTPLTGAVVGVPYSYRAAAGAATYQLTQSPAGMTIDPATGQIAWTPAVGQMPTAAVTVRAADAAGNAAEQQFTISVSAADTALSGYVYYDTNYDGQKSPTESGLAGVSVRLTDQNGGHRWTQTNSAGVYGFQGLAAGRYVIQIFPSSEVTVGQSTRAVQLAAGENRGAQDLAVIGLQPSLISLRLFLASTPPMPHVIRSMHVAPSVSLNGTGSSSSFATTYTTDAAPAAIASSAATISSPDSATLVSMTVTLQNRLNGDAEQLQAVTAGTSLTSNYAGGVLTVSGVADVATYQSVLRSITYSNAATPVNIAARTISVAVNDGALASASAVTTLTVAKGAVPAGYTIAANPSTLNATTAASAGFTFAGAQVGAAFSYSVSSSGGGTPVTGSGAIGSAAQAVTGINVSALSDGTLTYSAALTNGAGTGAATTATATLDKTAPSGYTVAADPATLTATTASSAGFVISGGEAGAAFSYSIGSSGGGTPVTGNGTIGSATHAVGGIDLSALSAGTLTFSVVLTDAAGNAGLPATGAATLLPPATVAARQVFYNNSSFDGGNAAATAADDNAIAGDKSALLPGGAATFANYTGYSRGINGIMVDLAGAANATAIAAADFTFKTGNDNTPSGWTTAPAPVSVTVRPGAGAGGADRVTIVWTDNAIQNQWLQVTVKANANTGLAADDVFYFGNAIAETGDNALNTVVDARDEQAVVAHFTGGTPATIADPYDLNRDGAVDAADTAVVQANHSGANPLVLLGRSAVLAVTAGDWTDAGLTLSLGADGLLHLYRTGTTTDAVPPVAATGIAGVQIAGRDGAADVLTVDFTGGSPIPGGGLGYNGGAGGSSDVLAIADAAGSDLLTMIGTQLIVNGSSVITLANVPDFRFDLGGSTLDLDGTTHTLGNLTLVSGLITNGALIATSVDVQGGEIRVTGLSTDSLTVSPGGSVVFVP